MQSKSVLGYFYVFFAPPVSQKIFILLLLNRKRNDVNAQLCSNWRENGVAATLHSDMQAKCWECVFAVMQQR